MPRLSFAQASLQALTEEMQRDPTVWVLGEDVRQGGVFGQYNGLYNTFGANRVVDTPIAEATIMGAGLGAALVGTRPVIEMRIADFVLPAMDELVNQIAKIRYMFGGQARANLVVRLPHGMLPGSAAQHSQTIENWFVNVPGLVVMTPATAADLAGMLKAAIRIDDPVLLFEPKALFKQIEEVPEVIEPILPGKATLRREGQDITIVTWSLAVRPSLAAADQSGLSCEVIDLGTLWPWDADAVARSLAKTKRLLVVQEGVNAGGFGGEVVAEMVGRLGVDCLKSAKRIGAPRIPVPFAPTLESEIVLTSDKIMQVLREMMAQ